MWYSTREELNPPESDFIKCKNNIVEKSFQGFSIKAF